MSFVQVIDELDDETVVSESSGMKDSVGRTIFSDHILWDREPDPFSPTLFYVVTFRLGCFGIVDMAVFVRGDRFNIEDEFIPLMDIDANKMTIVGFIEGKYTNIVRRKKNEQQ